MKKALLIFSLVILLTSCAKDPIVPIVEVIEVPEALVIEAGKGIKVENTIVSSEVRMNVKLDFENTYRVKMRDISNTLISQEKIQGKQGDNLLKVYVSSLANDSYVLELAEEDHTVIGRTTIVVQK